jgi:hypothetical protein
MSETRVIHPGLNDTLDAFKLEIFRDLNVARPGVVQSIDLSVGTVTVKLLTKEWLDSVEGVSIDYPLLTDVPILVLQGDGAFLELPITEGDDCLVVFSDRDIDNWWTAGAEGSTPNTLRKHSLSDGFAIVGLNAKTAPLALAGSFRLFGGSHKVDLANNAQALSTLISSLFSNIDTLFSDIDNLITSIKGIITTGSATTQAVSAASQLDLTAKATALSTLKGNFDSLKTNFGQLLGS